jgi:hypothetical protein
MLKNIAFKALVFALIVFSMCGDSLAQSRINFRRGASSATVSGALSGKGYREYLLRGRAGQVLSIRIRSDNGSITANAGTASGRNFSVEMSGGDHLISVYNSGNGDSRYTMTVSIR